MGSWTLYNLTPTDARSLRHLDHATQQVPAVHVPIAQADAEESRSRKRRGYRNHREGHHVAGIGPCPGDSHAVSWSIEGDRVDSPGDKVDVSIEIIELDVVG